MINQKELTISLVLAAVLAVGISGIAITQTHAESRTINADKVTIKKGEDITINVNGGKGAKGDTGEQGPPGPAGVQGPAGVNGTNGIGVNPEQYATLQTILALYQNGSLSSVSINAENLSTPTPPVTNESNTTTTTNTTSTTDNNGTTTSNSTSETVPASFIGSLAHSLGF